MATRHAIASAALDLLREHGYDALTIDLVAERAGISRRTFFNYFPSINEALHDHLTRIFEQADTTLAEQASQLPIMDAVMATLQNILTEDQLEKVAYLAIMGESIPSLHSAELTIWSRSIRYITPRLIAAHPEKDPFVITVFTQALLAACTAAFQTWAHTATMPLTPTSLDQLGHRLTSAMGLVRDGFTELHIAGKAR